ncbi:unnamed protein product, partial [Symbiodinium sp. CCMP2456]
TPSTRPRSPIAAVVAAISMPSVTIAQRAQLPVSSKRAGQHWRSLNVGMPLTDGRHIDVLANGLPLWQGDQTVTRASDAQFSRQAVAFLRQLAYARARELAVAAQRALAYSSNLQYPVVLLLLARMLPAQITTQVALNMMCPPASMNPLPTPGCMLRRALHVALDLIRTTSGGAGDMQLVRAWKLDRFSGEVELELRNGSVGTALTAAPLAPATDATFDQLADPTRRPREPHETIEPELLNWNPSSLVQLDRAALLTNLRRARYKGVAPGLSGFTAEVVRVVLDADDSTQAFVDVASLLVQAHVPEDIRAALGLGRMVAIRKPTGGTRGL